MIKTSKSSIGKAVIYKKAWMKPENWEYGIITGLRKSGVLVRYGTEKHSELTGRSDLYWDNVTVNRSDMKNILKMVEFWQEEVWDMDKLPCSGCEHFDLIDCKFHKFDGSKWASPCPKIENGIKLTFKIDCIDDKNGQ